MIDGLSRYLFVGSHPDDIEIAAMGWLLKLIRAGKSVGLLVLTDGKRSDPCDTRSIEQSNVFNDLLLKYPTSFFLLEQCCFPNGSLEEYETELRSTIEEIISRYSVDCVVTHFPYDYHHEHRACSEAVTDASRKITTVYFESVNSRGFIPNLFIELDQELLEEKKRYMKFHHSQLERTDDYFIKKIEAMALSRGSETYLKYAEGYRILRFIVHV